MDAIEFFLKQHARLHTTGVGPTEAPSMEDGILDDLTDDRIRSRPEGLNSLAWVFWHMARVEDVATNLVASEAVQVLDEEGWVDRLGVGYRDIGTEMGDEQVAELNAAIDVPALRAYRAAVGRRTQAVVGSMDPASWDAIVTPAGVDRARSQGAFGPGAEWVAAIWTDTTLGFLLGRSSILHNALHVGEAQVIAGRI